MKNVITILFLLLLGNLYSQTESENYVRTISPKSEFSVAQLDDITGDSSTKSTLVLHQPVSTGDFKATQSITLTPSFHATGNVTIKIVGSSDEVLEQISYFDGLGRSTQTIAKRQSPDRKDIIQFADYDQFGRASKSYLPYASSQNTGNFISDPKTQQTNYYQSNYGDTYSYGETIFDDSPLNRAIESAPPGYDWRIIDNSDNDHTIKKEYATNTSIDKIIKFTINDSGSSPVVNKGAYVDNQLLKNVTKNENWQSSDGVFHTVESYSDKNGRVIARINYEEVSGSPQKRITQNIYDTQGRLRYILPPKALVSVNTTSGTFTINDDLVYQYQYDENNRQIGQKVPGRDWEYLVYDQLDRPILVQDANLKDDDQWLFTKYDVFGRPVYSGIYSSSLDREQLQASVDNYVNSNNNNIEAIIEKRLPHYLVVGNFPLNYTTSAFPTSSLEILSVNYYDDYTFFDSDKPLTPTSIQGQTVTTRMKGLKTANFHRTLGQSSWTKLYIYYDEKGHQIKVYNKNHLGGYTTSDSKLDFKGKTELSITKHKRNATSTELVINDRFTYDYAQRLSGHFQKINNQVEERIAENIYDEMGIRIGKKVGGATSAQPLQELTYAYTIKGQFKALNNVNSLDNNLFAYKINYSETTEGVATVPKRFDGSISQTIWRSSHDNIKKSYSYEYSKLNRLSQSKYQKNNSLNGNTSLSYNTSMSYDEQGNTTSLSRKNSSGTTIDQLSYDYGAADGNQLFAVSDTGSSLGFVDGNTGSNDYAYDSNGNMTKDLNKGISLITYNHQDLVDTVTFTGGKSVSFTYNASGSKLHKQYAIGNTTITEDYLGGFHYKQGNLQFLPTPEGYVYKSGSSYKHMYIYADHLGNSRVNYSDVNGNGILESAELASNRDYYPFGGVHNEQFSGSIASGYNYTYQGKEYQAENSLNWHDFGSRMYDSSLGRWMTPDPQNQFASPYMAMGNNPINSIDPDGEYAQLIAALVGGVINTAVNYKNIDNWGDGLSYFGIGAVSGFLATTGAGAIGSAAFLGVGNSAYTQHKYTGTIDYGQLTYDGLVSAGTAFGGGVLSRAIAPHAKSIFGGTSLFSRISKDAVTNVTSGIIVETSLGVATGKSLNDALSSSTSLESIGQSIVIGSLQSTTGYYKDKHLAKVHAEKTAIQKAQADIELQTKQELNLPAIELTTSSKKTNPSLNYTIFLEDGTVWKFGVTAANGDRLNKVLRYEAPPNSTYTLSKKVVPKFQAHINEKYMRSLYYNTTGIYIMDGMKVPFPVDFDTGFRIKL